MNKIKELVKNKELVAVLVFAVVMIALIVVGFVALKEPLVAVASVLIIECAIAVAFHHVELWVHGVILIVEIVTGVVIARTGLMVLCVIAYIAATATLTFIKNDDLATVA